MADAAQFTAEPDTFAQRRSWRPFRDPSVEAKYRAWHRDQILPVARIIGAGSLALWASIPIWMSAAVGEVPRALYIGNWGVAVPVLLTMLIGSFTAFRRWAVQGIAVVNIVLGLDIIWVMASAYSPVSGTVACGMLAIVFYPMILRLPTVATAFVAIPLTAVPVALQINGMRQGDISPSDSWSYVAVMVTVAPMMVVAAAMIEAAMRQQFAAQSELRSNQELLRRYLPEQVADAVLSNRSRAVERHERRKLTIFFSDLVGFTDLSDEMEPEDLATVLHDYFTEMSTIARKHSGTIDDLIGDAILVLFGAPDFTDDRDQALRAVRMAVEMQEAMVPLHQRWASAGIAESLRVRMGINTGLATVGNFGSAERTKYTALGKQVNVAARIQSQCEPGRVLIGHTTWLLVRDEIACLPKGELELKGLRKPMPAYEVQG